MTIDELREVLRRRPVPPDAYRLDDGGAEEAFVLDKEGDEWVVYYAERGLRTEERRFDDEAPACQELYDRLSRSFRFVEDQPTSTRPGTPGADPEAAPGEAWVGVSGGDVDRTSYFLSSLDSHLFEPVRSVVVRDRLVFDSGKAALLVDIDPPVVGQGFGLGHDVSSVVLTSRVEGREIDAIEELPFFVHIATSRHGWTDLASPLRADDLVLMAWGELYATAEAARSHSFD